MSANDTTPEAPAPVDENRIIAERRAKLTALRAKGQAFPNDFRRDSFAGDLHAQHGEEANEDAGAEGHRGRGRRAHDAQARDGQGQLRHAAGHVRTHPALRDPRRHRRGRAGRLQALGPGRHRRRRRHAVPDHDRRAVGQGERHPPADQGAAAAAGEVPRPDRPGTALPPALRRPDRQPRLAGHLPQALADHRRRCASSSSRAAISRSRRR